jgi:glucose dehydrogenase
MGKPAKANPVSGVVPAPRQPFMAAVDYRSGKIVWRQRAGYGRSFDNLYAGIALGRAPGGKPTLYLGGVSGIRALQDR